MSALVDNVIALKLLKMLVTPFNQTEAFRLGIIDAKGKVLKPVATLQTQQEKDAYNYLDRLVFNVKRLVNKLPGGESQLKNLTAAYFMVREKYEGKSTYINEKQFTALVEKLNKVTLVEEELAVIKALDEAKMSAAARLQKAFERERQKSEASRRRGEELMQSIRDKQKSEAPKTEGFTPVVGNGDITAKKYSAPFGRPDAKGIERIKKAKEAEKKHTGLYKKQTDSERKRTVSNLMKMVNQIGENTVNEEGEGGGAPAALPANHTGVQVSTVQPKVGATDIKKYKKKNAGAVSMARRPAVNGC